MRIDYGQGEQEAVLSIHTMMLYEQEFGRDIIQDLFGKAKVRKDEEEEDVLFSVDYRDTNWTSAVRVLWAALKTADDSLPPFSEWERSLGAVNLHVVAHALMQEALRQFFRTGASDS